MRTTGLSMKSVLAILFEIAINCTHAVSDTNRKQWWAKATGTCKDGATVEDARKSLGRIRRRLMQELQRIGPINWERR